MRQKNLGEEEPQLAVQKADVATKKSARGGQEQHKEICEREGVNYVSPIECFPG